MLPTTTLVGPVVALLGTVAVIWVSDHPVTVPVAPLKNTAFVPCVWPKPDPLITTLVPEGPALGERAEMTGFAKDDPLPTPTLSKVTVASEVVLPLLTPKPT